MTSTRRSKSGTRRSNQPKHAVYDCKVNGEYRFKGSARQVVEKLIEAARQAGLDKDTVLQQTFLQHAEHYQRVINESV